MYGDIGESSGVRGHFSTFNDQETKTTLQIFLIYYNHKLINGKSSTGENIIFPTPTQLCFYTLKISSSEHIILIIKVKKKILLL